MLLRLRISVVALTLTLSFLSISAQKLKKADKITQDNLETHIRYFSDEKPGGRKTGTPGEKSAADYISSAFSQAGLLPKGDHNGWLQAFTIDEGRQISSDAYLTVNDQPFGLNKDYFPLAFSGVGTIEGSPAIALQESGEPWFLDLKEILEGNSNDLHFDLAGAIRSRVVASSKKGATAIILYNSSKRADNLVFDPHDKPVPVSIPVIYITRDAKRKYLKDESASLEIKLRVGFTEKSRTGHNVTGYLDNGAANTVLIAAHYDNGGDTLLLSKGEVTAADDHASGVAAAIELARLLRESRLKGNNYLFVAFSGEEEGSYGSRYFVEHLAADGPKLNYMIDLDRVGGLNDSSHSLVIGGYGSSPAWEAICNRVVDKKSLALRFDSSVTRPRTLSFYRKGIPGLFFFTGNDVAGIGGKVNYAGELQVVKFIYAIVQNMNGMGRIAFKRP
jgi:aminopeptidase YwaD